MLICHFQYKLNRILSIQHGRHAASQPVLARGGGGAAARLWYKNSANLGTVRLCFGPI